MKKFIIELINTIKIFFQAPKAVKIGGECR